MNEEAEIIDLGQQREARALRVLKGGNGPPRGTGPNWLADLPVGQRFLCKDRTIGGSEHRDCVVTTDPTDVSCLISFSAKGRDGYFEWHDPKLFSQQHTLIMTLEAINGNDVQLQPGSMERHEDAEDQPGVHED